ncbi:tyrosine-protein phosphatase [Halobacillus salinus]|uniref:Tyrosine-protein phosphatase n=1 Tax=Halobacillus salinus TaxID=192814 RepID=A0A4Z0GVG7_9BACI|nr:CpsB/CapC family capsule biosynthesis tyrosine phosphatase [Halobacillus salinus]TGB01713.1 tyrosine protein phosphatase [Halobacillus salinus]
MIDIHSHLLPGVDDGSETFNESIEMAKKALEDGIDTIVATPHHRNELYDNYKNDIKLQVSELNRKLKEENVPVKVLPGQEIHLHGELMTGIKEDEIISLGGDSNFLLIEFPTSHVPRYANQMLYDLQIEGYRPIIAHPERNQEILEQPDVLYSLVKKGAFAQVNAGSLCGDHGSKVKKLSYQLIEHNLAHLVASDAHRVDKKSFRLSEAYSKVEKKLGSEFQYMLMENAQAVVDGDPLILEPPRHIRNSKVFGLF